MAIFLLYRGEFGYSFSLYLTLKVELVKNIRSARDGDRTHAHIRELDLKSNALTTRPPGLIEFMQMRVNTFIKI